MRASAPWASLLVLSVACGGSAGGPDGGGPDRPGTGDGSFSDGALPDGALPDGALPDGRIPGDGAIDAEPVSVEAFCDEYVDAICADVASCGCEGGTERCERAWRASCEGARGTLGPDIREAIAAGEVRYDAEAAGRLVAQARAMAAGCQTPGGTQTTLADVLSLHGVLQGTRGAGEPCSTWDLRPSRCEGMCFEHGDGVGECVSFAGAGEVCDSTTILCWDTDQPLDVSSTLSWDRTCSRDGETRRCGPARDEGASCEHDRQCDSWWCLDGQCETPGGTGARCSEHWHCGSGYCDPDGGACAPGEAPVGADCANGPQCASNECTDGRCQAALCAAIDRLGASFLDENIDIPRDPEPPLSSCDPAATEMPPCGIPSWAQHDAATVGTTASWRGGASSRIGQTAALGGYVVAPVTIYPAESDTEFDLAMGVVDVESLQVETFVLARGLPATAPGDPPEPRRNVRTYATTVGDRVLVVAPGYWGWVDPEEPGARMEGDLATVLDPVFRVGAAAMGGAAVLVALVVEGSEVSLETATAAVGAAPVAADGRSVHSTVGELSELTVGAIGTDGIASWSLSEWVDGELMEETLLATFDAVGAVDTLERWPFGTAASGWGAAQSYRVGDTLQRWVRPGRVDIDPALGELTTHEVVMSPDDSAWLGDGYLLLHDTPGGVSLYLANEDGSEAWFAGATRDLFPYRLSSGVGAITRVPCHGVVLTRLTEHVGGREDGDTVLNAVFGTCPREP